MLWPMSLEHARFMKNGVDGNTGGALGTLGGGDPIGSDAFRAVILGPRFILGSSPSQAGTHPTSGMRCDDIG